MVFKDRLDAAQQLSTQLLHYRDRNPLVLGIPRGGVVLAAHIAATLNGELDVLMVRKIGAPGNAEYAMGCVTEAGQIFLNEFAYQLASEHYISETAQAEVETMRDRRQKYTPFHTSVSARNRIVILVDDGVATGATFSGAIAAVRAQAPKKLIAAIPVAPTSTAQRLRSEVDTLIVLHTVEPFYAIGYFYENFDQVSNSEVIRLLSKKGVNNENKN